MPDLVSRLSTLDAVEDLALTTNATRIAELAQSLKESGLGRVTISLDTLRSDRFHKLTRTGELSRVLTGIDAIRTAGFDGTKLNAVLQRGVNDDEIGALLAFAHERDLELRFIEYMDVGGATRWSMERVVSATEILKRIEAEGLGVPEPVGMSRSSAPADRFRLPNGQMFGVIASTTRPFCGQCDRARLTADGRFITCLYGKDGYPITPILRSAGGPEAAAARMLELWSQRSDRGAEERLAEAHRDVLAQPEELRSRPHLEMHTRGG